MAGTKRAPDLEAAETPVAALEKLAVACRILDMEGHASRTLGHAALRDPAGRGFWLKGWGLALEEVTGADDFILLDFDGAKLAGSGRRHTEWPIHAELFRARPEIDVSVHTHPFYGRVFSAVSEPLLPVSNAGGWFTAPPPRFDQTSELVRDAPTARAIAETLGGHYAVFLRNHGVVFCAETIETALMVGIQLDEACHEQLVIGASGLAWESPPAEEHARKTKSVGVPASLAQYFDYYTRKLARRDRAGA
jgi:ribulose-5-phosphate 4-epimerase/fuculose-1-phosphate aldolase